MTDEELVQIISQGIVDGANDGNTIGDHARGVLRALRAEGLVVGKVKPLEWVGVSRGIWAAWNYDVWHEWLGDGKFHVGWVNKEHGKFRIGNGFPSLDAAKAAAQADYEARIRGAIE